MPDFASDSNTTTASSSQSKSIYSVFSTSKFGLGLFGNGSI